MKNFLTLFISVVLVLAFLGCDSGIAEPTPTATPEITQTIAPTPTKEPTPMPTPEPTQVPITAKSVTIGFVVRDDGSYEASAMMYGFLNTARILGYTSVLLRYGEDGVNALDAVEMAHEHKCEYIAITNPTGTNDAAIKKAEELNIKVVVVGDKVDVSEAVIANIAMDDSEYIKELCVATAQRMKERKLTSGWILVYGQGVSRYADACKGVIAELYPEYGVVIYNQGTGTSDQEIEELAEYLYYNRQFGGLIAVGDECSRMARDAREKASARLSEEGAVDNQNPPAEFSDLPPVDESITDEISISIFGTGYSEDNISLLKSSGIYGLSIMPYYDLTVYAVMLMDSAANEMPYQAETIVPWPIIRYDTIDRYVDLHNEVCELFDLIEDEAPNGPEEDDDNDGE